MLTALVAAVVVVIVLAGSAALSRRATTRAARRIDAVRHELDGQLRALVEDLQTMVERAHRAQELGAGELGLMLDLDELLMRVSERAATDTGGQAAAARVRGPGDAPAVASFGVEEPSALLESLVPPPGRRPYRALSVSWSLPASDEHDGQAFGAALVVPIVEEGVESGTLAAFAYDPSTFHPDATRLLEALAEEAAPAIARARRFAQATVHPFGETLLPHRERTAASPVAADPLELFRQRLAREVERALGLEEGLAVLVVSADLDSTEAAPDDSEYALADLATRLGEGLREAGLTTPIDAGRIGVLLPRSTAADAESLYEALRASSEQRSPDALPRLSLCAGITELVPGDDAETVLERVQHALVQARQLGTGVVVVATAGGHPLR